MPHARFRRLRAASALLACLATGCATTRLETQWRDPQYSGPSLRGSKILVVCRVADETVRRVCEDQWAMQLATRGTPVVRSYAVPDFPANGAASAQEIQAAVRSTGAAATASTDLAFSLVPVVQPAPVVGIGVGGGAWGGGGGFGSGGIGISVPIGGGTTATMQRMAATTGVTGAATGALLWSGTATTQASGNAAAQISDLVATTIDAIQKSGLL